MSAFTRLWRRAPLWRLSFIGMILCGSLTVLYPPHWLVTLYPPIASLIHHAPPTPPGDEDDQGPASGASNSPAPQSQSSQSQQTESQQTQPQQTQAAATPIDANLRDIIPLAGRQFPLPVGIWHPVLTEQKGPHGEIIGNILVRTDRGVVTGVIISDATTVSIPATGPSYPHPSCEPGRAVSFRRFLPSPVGTTECVLTLAAPTPNGQTTPHSDIDWAFHRLHLLGFPMPPVLVATFWVHVVKNSASDSVNNSGGNNTNFEMTAIALSPAEPGTTHISSPLADWTPQGIGTSPFAGRFVNSVNDWMLKWASVLRQGYEGKLQPVTDSIRPDSIDPAWHGSGDRPPI